MSVVISKKRQILFGIILVAIVLIILEVAANIWFLNAQHCEFEHSEIYQHLDKDKIREICKDHFRTKALGFDLLPNQNTQTININSLGFRGPDFSPDKSSGTYRVFVVGGSTVFGSGSSSDETTISGFLQDRFTKNLPDKNIEIINAGVTGGNSKSNYEAIVNKISQFEPDMVIIYEGWNDLRALYSTTLTIGNWEKSCDLGKKEGFDVVVMLQPISGFGNKVLTEQERINALTGKDHYGSQLLLYKQNYQQLADKMKDLDRVCFKTIDMRGVFDNITTAVYFDQGHMGDVGNNIIAQKMYDVLLPRVNESSKTVLENNNVDSNLKLVSADSGVSTILASYKTPSLLNYFINNPTKEIKLDSDAGKYFELKNNNEVILVGSDLTNIDISTISITGKDLTGANLSGHDLSSINLEGTILTGANLSYVDLHSTNLSNKDLRGANFSYANLNGAKLDNVRLGTIIQAGHIENTDLIERVRAIFKITSDFSPITTFSNANLDDAYIKTDLITLVDFSHTTFVNAELNF